jgi:hypothetical protein
MSSDVLRNWNKIIHKNVRSKDMDGVVNVVAINEDSISITTQGSQHIYKIPKSHIEGYNGAEVFLDLSAADMSTYDIDSKSQALKEETTTTAAKSAAEVSTSTPTTAQTQTSSITEKITGSPTTDLASSRNAVIIDNKRSSPPNEALRTKREAEEKARREAEAIEHTTIKESIEPQRQQTVRQENLVTSRENANYLRNDREPFSANMTLWQYSTLAWIDMYKEFAVNAAKLSEYWFNLFWSPWTKEQRKDKIKVE